jgi:hypothetical protein
MSLTTIRDRATYRGHRENGAMTPDRNPALQAYQERPLDSERLPAFVCLQ